MTNLYDDNDKIFYEVRLDDKILSKNSNKILAEASLNSLNDDEKQRAIIVPVTKTGKQYLLG